MGSTAAAGFNSRFGAALAHRCGNSREGEEIQTGAKHRAESARAAVSGHSAPEEAHYEAWAPAAQGSTSGPCTPAHLHNTYLHTTHLHPAHLDPHICTPHTCTSVLGIPAFCSPLPHIPAPCTPVPRQALLPDAACDVTLTCPTGAKAKGEPPGPLNSPGSLWKTRPCSTICTEFTCEIFPVMNYRFKMLEKVPCPLGCSFNG